MFKVLMEGHDITIVVGVQMAMLLLVLLIVLILVCSVWFKIGGNLDDLPIVEPWCAFKNTDDDTVLEDGCDESEDWKMI